MVLVLDMFQFGMLKIYKYKIIVQPDKRDLWSQIYKKGSSPLGFAVF